MSCEHLDAMLRAIVKKWGLEAWGAAHSVLQTECGHVAASRRFGAGVVGLHCRVEPHALWAGHRWALHAANPCACGL
eukprot:241764-Prymnesium_polylepis.1